MNFDHDILDGGLSAVFDRGYGNGSGMSHAIKAVFQKCSALLLYDLLVGVFADILPDRIRIFG